MSASTCSTARRAFLLAFALTASPNIHAQAGSSELPVYRSPSSPHFGMAMSITTDFASKLNFRSTLALAVLCPLEPRVNLRRCRTTNTKK